MGTHRVTENTYRNYRRKRNLLLFFLIVPATIIMVSLVWLYTADVLLVDTLITIYLPLVVIDLIVVYTLQPKITLYSMYCDYTLMLEEEHKPFKTSQKLFTTKWINEFKKDGYIVSQDQQSYVLLYKYSKKLEGIVNSGSTVVFIVIAKNSSLDFYGDEIDLGIQAVYLNHEEIRKAAKRITLQFKKYDLLDELSKKEIESSILFNSGAQRIINLTLGYFDSSQTAYSICPTKRYPNKYVYYACQEIQKYS